MDDGKLYLGIDYGGNAVKLGLLDSAGQLSGKASWPTATFDLEEKAACRAFAAEIGDFVHGMGLYSSELGGVGLALPGIISENSFTTPNVKADWPCVLDSLRKAFPKQSIAVLNDANAAALGELWMGAGTDADSVLLVTLGSGLGSGLVVDGRVVVGGHGAAGEVGHMTVVPGGRPCKCGRLGCIERYASARGIVLTFNEAASSGAFDESLFSSHVPQDETDALSVYQAASEGDPRAIHAFDIMADKLGYALAQVACVVDPGVILLGGGITAAADIYLEKLRKSYRSYSLAAVADTEIRCSSLLGDAGVYGAARYAIQQNPLDGSQRDWLDPDFGL